MMRPDGTGQKQLTDDPDSGNAPTWSPDGTKIAFTAGRDEVGEEYGDSDVYTMNPDSTDERDLTRNANLNEYDPTWSPSGGKIAFVGYRSGDQSSSTPISTARAGRTSPTLRTSRNTDPTGDGGR